MQYRNNNIKKKTSNHRLFGSYFVEAGLVSSKQIKAILLKQKTKYPHKKIGEILVDRGLLKQNTINYFVEKVIQPEGKTQNDYLVNDLDIYIDDQKKKANVIAVNLYPQKICKLLLAIAIILIVTSILTQTGTFFLNQYSEAGYSGRLFDLNEESNIPTFYSAFNLAICSILLAFIAYKKQKINSRYTNHWKFLSVFFFLLSVDEIAMIHELLSVLRKPLNASGFFYFTWVIPAGLFLIIFTVIFSSFIKSLPKKVRNLFILSGIIYVGGAIGIEMISAYHAELHGENNLIYKMITTVEESLEMMGILVFIYSLLFYLQNYLGSINLSVSFKKEIGH